MTMNIIMLSIFLFGCHHRKMGVIDIIDNGTCSIQLEDSTMILVSSSVCKGLREGDTIEVKHDKSR